MSRGEDDYIESLMTRTSGAPVGAAEAPAPALAATAQIIHKLTPDAREAVLGTLTGMLIELAHAGALTTCGVRTRAQIQSWRCDQQAALAILAAPGALLPDIRIDAVRATLRRGAALCEFASWGIPKMIPSQRVRFGDLVRSATEACDRLSAPHPL